MPPWNGCDDCSVVSQGFRQGLSYKSDSKATDLMALVGYARCSTTHQDTAAQLQGLEAAQCDQVFSEYIGGAAPYDQRVELQNAISACNPGDVLVVAKLDRLGRTMEDCVSRVAELLDRDIHVRTLDGRVDTKGLGQMAKMVWACWPPLPRSSGDCCRSAMQKARSVPWAGG